MIKFSKKQFIIAGIILIFLITLIILNDSFEPKPVKSASTDNVSGWAWSETIGWISFNGSNYGVNLNLGNGKFSGYAWSEYIGWISFKESDLSGCPQAPCRAEAIPPGQLGRSNVNIKGWARALAYGGGWDGWIRFDHGRADQAYIDPNGDFHGWAWGDIVVGWLSFNCADRGVCASSNYKVTTIINNLPSVSCNDAETWNYCLDSRNPTLFWNYSDPDGDPQESYQIQIDDNPSFSSPEIDTGEVFSSGNSYSPSGTTLNWNTTYRWRVKVKDNRGAWSNWSTPNCSFTTPPHAYPDPDFSWSPQRPSALEPVQFTDNSTCYDDIISGSPCSSPDDSFKWTIPKTQYVDPLITFEENPVATFSQPGTWDVTLEVTDDIGACSEVKPVRVNFPLPRWKEIIPR